MLKMKSRVVLLALFFNVVSVHANANMTLTQRVLKPVIQYQCEQEVDQSNIWKMATYLMNADHKKQLKQDTCDCVSDHALKDIPAKELAKAVVDDKAKEEVIQKAMMNSLKSCVIRSKL